MKTNQIAKTAALLVAAGITVGLSTSAVANIDLGTFTASGASPSDGKAVAASATFVDLGGGKLQVTLVNTYLGATYGIGDTIYGLYFSGASGLTLESAQAPTGSKIWDLTGVANGGTGSYTTLSSAQDIAWQMSSLPPPGVSALVGGNQTDGLVSAGFAGVVTDGLANSNHNPFVQNTAVFVLDYTNSITSISGVQILFGTSVSTADTLHALPIPEAGTVLAGMLLLLPLGASTLRILRKNRMG